MGGQWCHHLAAVHRQELGAEAQPHLGQRHLAARIGDAEQAVGGVEGRTILGNDGSADLKEAEVEEIEAVFKQRKRGLERGLAGCSKSSNTLACAFPHDSTQMKMLHTLSAVLHQPP